MHLLFHSEVNYYYRLCFEMLCPEVWNFDPPPFSTSTIQAESEEELFRTINRQYFNHFVCVTLPNTLQLPNALIGAALDDSQFYRINEVPASELVKKEFVDLFVSKGRLTSVSLNEFSEQDSLVITPCGKLVFCFNRSTYYKLGIECTFKKCYKNSVKKYFLVLDFTSDSVEVKKKCEQVQKKLTAHYDPQFDIILAWEPDSPDICPSSIAFYFSKKGYFVKSCDVLYTHRVRYNVTVPMFDKDGDMSELIEWLGAHSLDCDMSNDSYISAMKAPENSKELGQVMQLTFTGLISHSRLENIIKEIDKHLKATSPLMWISLTVQGFQDKILSVQNKQFCLADGDHHLTIIFRLNQPCLVYSFQDKKV